MTKIIIWEDNYLEFYNTNSHNMKAIATFVVLVFFNLVLQAQNSDKTTRIATLLQDKTNLSKLYYPKSVLRFYTKDNMGYTWFEGSNSDQPEIAVLLLGYADQFGLSSSGYHCQELSPEKLMAIIDSKFNDSDERAWLDILMTDALITFINNLHFGKYNPKYTSSDIDAGYINGFCSDDKLSFALSQNDFLRTILEVQPQIHAYKQLQDHLNTLYANDLVNTSQSQIEKIVINMERLRWINTISENYILVNIPSYSLELHTNKIQRDFKVIVGKPSTPSPILESVVTHFTTAPDWKVPQSIFRKEMLPKILKNSKYLTDHHYSIYDRNGNEVTINPARLKEISRNTSSYSVRQSSGCDNALGAVVFRFENTYGIYLHDTSQKQLFNKEERALSHGCVRVEQADKLAKLLLENDRSEDQLPILENAMANYKRKDFVLKQPIPIIITYLTYSIKNGRPVFYKDIYHLDSGLIEKVIANK
ncbi:L,D-transpeptidase family protein [Epilithonimonas hungarica]|nr:L,D-transpeptidase family protein [Epilithonimonas hungarica]